MFSNFHTHCCFCDGKGRPEEYVQQAIKLGFKAIGFSSHAPLPFSNVWTMKESDIEEYFSEIGNLKTRYKDKIQIYTGMEIDYFSKKVISPLKMFSNYNLDYTIGSIHFIFDENSGKFLSIDGEYGEYVEIIEDVFKGNVREFIKYYYTLIGNMIEEYKPNIVGHLDIVKKNNKNNQYFDDEKDWYREEIMKTLQVIKKYNTIVEVNTGGKARGYMDNFYPSTWIIKECKKLNIPVMLNSDAHCTENLNAYFEEAQVLLNKIGYNEQCILHNSQWKNISFCSMI